MTPIITAYDWVPAFAQGQVRDLTVRWAMEEVGRPYRVRYLRQGEQKAAAHRALQPFGQVPTYEEGDLVLFESAAIVLQVAEGAQGLLPGDPAARARARAWMFAAVNSIEPALMERPVALFLEGDRPWSAERLALLDARIDARLDELAVRLGEAEWLDGAFSAGDLMMVAALRVAARAGLLARQNSLARYVARGEARPAFGRALADHLAGFTGTAPAGFAAPGIPAAKEGERA